MNRIIRTIAIALGIAILAVSCQKNNPAPAVSLDEMYIAYVGEAITIAPAVENAENVTYLWTLDNSMVSEEPTFTYTFDAIGSHDLSVTLSGEGGIATASAKISVQYKMNTLTFEGDYWISKIDSKQYGGSLLYGDGITSVDYHWFDENNTMLASEPCAGINWTTFEEGYISFMNGGHAISNYINKDIEACKDNFQQQLSIPLEGGHSGENFCIHNGYISDFSKVSGYFYFKDGQGRVIDHMYVTNTSYYLGTVNAVATSTDWTKIVATGYDADGEQTGKAEFYLTKEGKSINEWTKWELSPLGAPVKVEFNIESSIANEYGMTAPAYFAYDDVAVRM